MKHVIIMAKKSHGQFHPNQVWLKAKQYFPNDANEKVWGRGKGGKGKMMRIVVNNIIFSRPSYGYQLQHRHLCQLSS